ncbi:hypothetical protein MNB_SV-8-1157 [hydrothermal vent metagenome]|uniref:Uncharacterized protein n=1 Tax=hydrothermal vent metagenome TaxID=652676 RepID=A0A1W1C5J9_9ZZZZ
MVISAAVSLHKGLNINQVVENLSQKWTQSLLKKYPSDDKRIDKGIQFLKNLFKEFINSDYSDPKFSTQITTKNGLQYEQALGELLFYDILKKNHFNFEKNSGKGPDFKVNKKGMTIWCEVITPQSDNAGIIEGINTNKDYLNPKVEENIKYNNEILLRITSALHTKEKKFIADIEKGLVQDTDCCIIVINDALLCPSDIGYFGMSHSVDSDSASTHPPLIAKATLLETSIKNKNGQEISLSGFLNSSLSHISAIIQVTLRDDYAYMEGMKQFDSKSLLGMVGLIKIPDIVLNNNSRNKISKELFDMKYWSVVEDKILSSQKPIEATKQDIEDYKEHQKKLFGI